VDDALAKVALEIAATSLLDQRHMYVLTPEKNIVCKFCVKHNIKHNFNSEHGCAGEKWHQLFFLRHHSVLSIRKPEGTSLHRALGYNRAKVKEYEKVLKAELLKNGDRRILKQAAQSRHTVTSARQLRQSQDEITRYDMYINENLTKAAARAAYEIRCQCRQNANQRSSVRHQTQQSSQNLAVPSVSSV